MMLPSCPRRTAKGGGRRISSPSPVSSVSSVSGDADAHSSSARSFPATAAPGAHSWTSLKMVPPATRRSDMRLPRSASEYSIDRREHSTRRSNAGGEDAAEARVSATPRDHCSTALSARPTATVVWATRASGSIGRTSCTQCPSGGSVRVTRSSRASGATPAPARSVATATLRSPQTRIARPPLAPDALATNASRSGEGRMPCTRADRNTVVESKGTSPFALKGSYHFRLAPVPASRVSCARGNAPSDAVSAASASSPVGGSAQSAVTSPTYTPRVSRREGDIVAFPAFDEPLRETRVASNAARSGVEPRCGLQFLSAYFFPHGKEKLALSIAKSEKRGIPFLQGNSGFTDQSDSRPQRPCHENMPRR